ncbi:DeoR/GlpR family DNA-binding transcription regulator [Trinickia sp. LjRoot230]|uniref:DeoR/GlpR family DNA-binding transcription regulator n=1 Tax=Trinickia sp. LjRoot230 TaxID=3342288 RepID=UPI003ECEFD28
MSLSPRQEQIVTLFRQHGAMSVDDLAGRFEVAPQTIRRDINSLCEANVLRRTYGGAKLLTPGVNQPYAVRRVRNLEGKTRIGAAAAALVPDGSTVLIGIGTTPEQVALALAFRERLTIVTNNLRAALALATRSTHRIVMPGGQLREQNPDILGPEADRLFREYRADFGIYGVGGIDDDGALLDYDRHETASREALSSSCRQRILVADNWKFNRRPPVRRGRLTDQHMLVTDAQPPETIVQMIRDQVKLIVAA